MIHPIRTLLILLFYLFTSFSIFCQEYQIPHGWTVIEISELGSIAIPPTIELRDDNSYLTLAADAFRDNFSANKKIEVIKPTLTFQPKGLNDLDRDAASKFCRILISIYKGENGEFLRNSEVMSLTTSDLQAINEYQRQEIEKDFQKIGKDAKLLKLDPVKLIEINSMAAIHISYRRQVMSQPPVLVKVYLFPNYDETIEITMSYRETEQQIWGNDFETVINTFRYIN
ncbi:MAG: hypothetical protein JXQ26_07090 [Tissierellales bacterium]|nr:hypothetical protein [Candidatus Dojkabacteria bacterium]MBN2827737.1 hypothetical protein [Tissierellales bacterium]